MSSLDSMDSKLYTLQQYEGKAIDSIYKLLNKIKQLFLYYGFCFAMYKIYSYYTRPILTLQEKPFLFDPKIFVSWKKSYKEQKRTAGWTGAAHTGKRRVNFMRFVCMIL